MKFICDQMLAQLGRWLRCAGYDTLIVDNGIADSEILEIARKENRRLLTKDKHFLKMKKNGLVIHLTTNSSIDHCVRELNQKLEIDWTLHPFSRCLVCNQLLKEIEKEKITAKVPEGVKKSTTQFWICPDCNRIYWEGSHTEKMRKMLESFSKLT